MGEELLEEKDPKSSEVDEKLKAFVDSKDYKIRACELYKQEFKGCTSFKGRFYQYFVDGNMKDCNEYKRDLINCEKWTDKNDYKAAEAIILSEEERIKKRLIAFYKNDVWEHRDTPPDDWAKPLPEWMQKEQENTYLHHKANELKTNREATKDTLGFCSIM